MWFSMTSCYCATIVLHNMRCIFQLPVKRILFPWCCNKIPIKRNRSSFSLKTKCHCASIKWRFPGIEGCWCGGAPWICEKNEDFENRIITETSPLPVFQTNLFAQFKAKEKALIQWGYDKEQESITNQVFDFAWTTSQRKQDPAQLWRTTPFIWRVEKEKSERERTKVNV